MMTTHFHLTRSLTKEDYFFFRYRRHGTRHQDSFTLQFILQHMLGQSLYSCFISGKFQVSISANSLAILIHFSQSLWAPRGMLGSYFRQASISSLHITLTHWHTQTSVRRPGSLGPLIHSWLRLWDAIQRPTQHHSTTGVCTEVNKN